MSVSAQDLAYFREVFLIALAKDNRGPEDALTAGITAVLSAERYGRRGFRVATTEWDRVSAVFQAAQTKYGVTRAQLVGPSKVASLARPREELYVGLRALGLSYPAVGRLVGGRHHTTVISGEAAFYARSAAEIEAAPEARAA